MQPPPSMHTWNEASVTEEEGECPLSVSSQCKLQDGWLETAGDDFQRIWERLRSMTWSKVFRANRITGGTKEKTVMNAEHQRVKEPCVGPCVESWRSRQYLRKGTEAQSCDVPRRLSLWNSCPSSNWVIQEKNYIGWILEGLEKKIWSSTVTSLKSIDWGWWDRSVGKVFSRETWQPKFDVRERERNGGRGKKREREGGRRMHTYISVLRGRHRQILGTPWPVSTADPVSPSPRETHCLIKQAGRCLTENTNEFVFRLSHGFTHTLTNILMHIFQPPHKNCVDWFAERLKGSRPSAEHSTLKLGQYSIIILIMHVFEKGEEIHVQ